MRRGRRSRSAGTALRRGSRLGRAGVRRSHEESAVRQWVSGYKTPPTWRGLDRQEPAGRSHWVGVPAKARHYAEGQVSVTRPRENALPGRRGLIFPEVVDLFLHSFQAFKHEALGLTGRGFVFVVAEEDRGGHTAERAEEADAGDHEKGGDDAAAGGDGVFVPVTDRCGGGDTPPDGVFGGGDVGVGLFEFGEQDTGRAEGNDEEGDDRNSRETGAGFALPQDGEEATEGANGDEQANHAKDAEHSTEAESFDGGNTGEEVDPAPLHKLQFGFGCFETDTEVDQQEHANRSIDDENQATDLGVHIENDFGRQTDQEDDRKHEDAELEGA